MPLCPPKNGALIQPIIVQSGLRTPATFLPTSSQASYVYGGIRNHIIYWIVIEYVCDFERRVHVLIVCMGRVEEGVVCGWIGDGGHLLYKYEYVYVCGEQQHNDYFDDDDDITYCDC